jgi:hypothetical protein
VACLCKFWGKNIVAPRNIKKKKQTTCKKKKKINII